MVAPLVASRPVSAQGSEEAPGAFGFVLLCLFVTSFLVHLPARIPVLGVLRFDLLLGLGAALAMIVSGSWQSSPDSKDTTVRRLSIIIAYIVLTLPFVRWPGTVVKFGLEQFLKSLFFYFLVVGLVTTRSRLRTFLIVILGCQVFRILEPFYLHVTEGYWGASTNMGNWELMDRLSGAPSDVINPNGLAQLVLETSAMLGFLLWPAGRVARFAYLGLAGLMFYVLLLTGSRSGFVVFALMVLVAIWRSKYRVVSLSLVAVAASFFLGLMTDLQKERYLSIVSPTAKGSASAEGRLEGLKKDFMVALERPVFGHGLGTSLEANANVRGNAQPSHNLFTETAQELGFVGLGLFLAFLVATVRNCKAAQPLDGPGPGESTFAAAAGKAILAGISVNLVFALASYGLSEYRWYLLAGLSVAVLRLAERERPEASDEAAKMPGRGRHGRVGALGA